VDHFALLEPTAANGSALLAAAEADWSRHVPHCPEWDAAGLVRHTGGIFTWMAEVVTTGEFVNLRKIGAAPDANSALPQWYSNNLDRTLAILRSADPDASVWTFSSLGERRAAWWRRRLAIEVAIHRWDAEHAANVPHPPIDNAIAVAGVGEFVTEFLPGLLQRAAQEAPTGVLHLQANDGPIELWLDLEQGGAAREDLSAASTSLRGSASDLLLWLTNRDPVALDVLGDRELPTRWTRLNR
jgi:uncharacterized protein (TIGR03083 family)